MYDEKTRARALELVAQGMTPRQASSAMGGRPSATVIRDWAKGKVPTCKRATSCVLTYRQKLDAVLRVEAGENYHDVAAEVGCSPTTLITWRTRWKQHGAEALVTRYDRLSWW